MEEGKEEIQGARVGMTFPVTETRENQHPPTPGVGQSPQKSSQQAENLGVAGK